MIKLRGRARILAEQKAVLHLCPHLPDSIDLDAVECEQADVAFAELYRRLEEYRKLVPPSNGPNQERDSERVISTPDVRRHGRASWVGESMFDGV